MRVLFLSPFVPHPPNDGGRQRVAKLLDALLRQHAVAYGGFGTDAELTGWAATSRFVVPSILALPGRAVDTDEASRLARAAGVSRLAWTRDMVKLGRSGLWERVSLLPAGTFDVVHAECSMMAPLAVAMKRREPALKLVIDLQNVEWHYKARVAVNHGRELRAGTAARRAVDAVRAFLLEASLYRRFDKVLVCSEADGARLAGIVPRGRILVVPNCAEIGPPPPPSSADSRRLVFVGSMAYGPNDVAALRFCQQILPRIRRRVPDAEFWIVGRSPSERVRQLTVIRGVHVTGAVPDVRPYLEAAAAAVVPLRTGGGTRLKILEAMAAERAVVSTAVGIEGIDAVPGRDFLLADRPEEFADRCVDLLSDVDLRRRVAAAGRRLVVDRYDWTRAQSLLERCYATLASSACDVSDELIRRG